MSGIETIVNWCRAHGVKVMFTFLDNWSPVDSISAVRWHGIHVSGLGEHVMGPQDVGMYTWPHTVEAQECLRTEVVDN